MRDQNDQNEEEAADEEGEPNVDQNEAAAAEEEAEEGEQGEADGEEEDEGFEEGDEEGEQAAEEEEEMATEPPRQRITELWDEERSKREVTCDCCRTVHHSASQCITVRHPPMTVVSHTHGRGA